MMPVKEIMSSENHKGKERWVVITIIASALFLLLRCFISFDFEDEAFYLSAADRLYRGDAFIIDEWWPTQFSSVLILPLYALFRLVTGNVDGVCLYFRIVYLLFCMAVSLYLYYMLRKRMDVSVAVACIAALTVMFYKKDNIEGLSYYNLNLLFTILLGLFLLEKKQVLAGISLSLAVLCHPYTACLFPLITIAYMIRRKRKDCAVFIMSVLACALLFLAWVCIRQDIIETIRSVPTMLGVINTHAKEGFVARVKSWIYLCTIHEIIYLFISVLFAVVLFVLKRNKHDKYAVLSKANIAMQLIVLVVLSIKELSSPGESNLFLVDVGVLIALTMDWHDRRYYPSYSIIVAGIIASLYWHLGSNTWTAMHCGFLISGIGVLIFLDLYIREFQGKDLRVVFISAMVICLLFRAYGRFVFLHFDASLMEISARIESGPGAGLYTSEDRKKQYDAILESIEMVNDA